jgi:hypothetical protein
VSSSGGSDRGDLLLIGHLEGGPAAAGGHDVRVVDLEAGAGQLVDVVDARPVDVGQALLVDEDLETLVLVDDVPVAPESNASWYWKPEQPPPRTPRRSPASAVSVPWEARNSRTLVAPSSVKVMSA